MSKQEIFDFLNNLDVCQVCILRYLNGRCTEYIDVDKSLFEVRGIERNVVKQNADTEEVDSKRRKANVCSACLGIFQGDLIESTVRHIIDKTDLKMYECDTIYTSVNCPIILQIRELSLWIALLQKFPNTISKTELPNITIKEIFKFLVNMKLCKELNKALEQNQNGILVNVFFGHADEAREIERLDNIKPKSVPTTSKKHKKTMTRNAFEKYYVPENLDLDKCTTDLPVPPKAVSTFIQLANVTISGPTIFIAGRYRKIAAQLCQTPWILSGKRVMDESVQEIITEKIVPYFTGTGKSEVNFMASGREDVDVRCLGSGRPFVVEIMNARRIKLPVEIAADMENDIDLSKKVSVQHLQLVKREELSHIKLGEESKKKIYRALCTIQQEATAELLTKLNIPNGMTIHQMTPLRVLHRRPLLSRPRQVHSVKAYVDKDNHKAIILDIVTQAGTYIKELVHGEFGRTDPSISSIIGQPIDIVALDVTAIDLDWPPEVDNKLLSRQQKKRIIIESAQ